MQQIEKLKGAEATVQNKLNRFFTAAILVIFAAFLGACGAGANNSGPGAGNETAATVNGKVITMQEVDRAVKLKAQGEETKMSPLELAGLRLQILQALVEQEVLFQKAQSQNTVPSEDEVTAALNTQKTQSGRSADQIEKEMKERGLTEATVREQIKKDLAIQKLIEKIKGKIEAPKDAEIDAFYAGNKEAFVKKKGVKLAAIIVDPTNSGGNDATVDEASAVLKANEILKQLQGGTDFATVAREKSEDQSGAQGGDLGYIAEEDLKQMFPAQNVAALMNPQFQIGQIMPVQSQGKYFIIKLQERSDKDEAVTLESPGIREQVTKSLIDARKQLLQASYQTIAMNEAKIENFLAKKVVENPNELTGARPAGVGTPPNANTAAPANANAPAANTNAAPANAKPAANAPAKPEAKPAAKAPAKPAAANK